MDHESRRGAAARAFDQAGIDVLVVSQLPNVRYLSGFSGSNGILVVSERGAVLITDGRYTLQAARECPGVEVTVTSGSQASPAPFVAEAARDLGGGRLGFEADVVTYQGHADLAAQGVDLVPTRGVVERIRWVKDPEEIAAIQAAQDVTDAAFDAIVGAFVEGKTERAVAFDLEAAMRKAGADALAFDPIVAFGPNAAEPHHRPTDRELARGNLVKMDFGALVGGYHSDMTRTVAFGEPDGRAREVYQAVWEAQRAGVDALVSGATGGQVDAVARDAVADAGFGDAFTHGLGHGVGLEIHEGPSLRKDGADVVPVDSVVTVEPGVYLAGELGVRIEDMVHVTPAGPRVMAASPKDLLVL
jgi:Xaa-Pro aminopeptidase